MPGQIIIYYAVIRRFGKLENADFVEWSDEKILEGGQTLSLFMLMRKNVC